MRNAASEYREMFGSRRNVAGGGNVGEEMFIQCGVACGWLAALKAMTAKCENGA